MRLHIRLGTATLAGLFAVSAIGASQAKIEDTSATPTSEASPPGLQALSTADLPDGEPSVETHDRELSEAPQPEATEISPSVQPETPLAPPSDDESTEEPLKSTECDLVDTEENYATITIPEAEPNDRVEVGGSDSYRVDSSSQIVVPYSGTTTLAMTVWRGEVQEFAECSVTISQNSTQPPETPSTPEPSDTPSTPEPSETPSTPEPSDTPNSTTPAPRYVSNQMRWAASDFSDSGLVVSLRCRDRLLVTIMDFVRPPIIEC